MNSFTRRFFLTRSSLLSLGAFPSLISRGVRAAQPDGVSADNRILVVIQMSGGNDGINTVVPYTDEGYAKHRKQLRLPTKDLIKMNGDVGLHPSMRSAADLMESGRMAIVQGVGYPNPNRSHDVSMAIWQSGEVDRDAVRTHGWIGGAMDKLHVEATEVEFNRNADMILMGDETTPLAIQSRRSTAVQMSDLNDLQLETEIQPPDTPAAGQLDAFVRKVGADAIVTSNLLQRALPDKLADDANYPSTQLAGRLRSIAALIKAGFTTPVYYTIQSGYDTHAAQLPPHSRLLREFSGAVKAFVDDLTTAGLSDRAMVMGFSEFGRRVAENGSAGTDHGTAGPVFLAGDAVQSALVGQSPQLTDLDGGDLRMEIDFRQIYHDVLKNWLFPQTDWSHLTRGKPLGLFKA